MRRGIEDYLDASVLTGKRSMSKNRDIGLVVLNWGPTLESNFVNSSNTFELYKSASKFK